MILLFCGLSGAGKSTLAEKVKDKLAAESIFAEIIDADIYRRRLFKDLGYSMEDRFENIRRLGFIANKFSSHNIITIVSAINPYETIRTELVSTYKNVKVVHIDCDVDELIRRDTKGLYKRAMLPEGHPDRLSNLTGINDPFEAPQNPDVYVNTHALSETECTNKICSFILNSIVKERYLYNTYTHVS
ncbi:adenylyl-sulfate kinase [Mucilaginibacter sp.]|jgi:adenylylsulfate kinase|uniref:adenylyl-sulfate kinase n=1 Tax=Mucilaginibacter sp. TaxID=1882438 RepID=UPI002C98E6EE|nr:adenylyl-sulfate kinase [Mucilaginibacter sp.]HTI58762.1 adenylyl-sulfate kinase [Mucilaginibacter sp.]